VATTAEKIRKPCTVVLVGQGGLALLPNGFQALPAAGPSPSGFGTSRLSQIRPASGYCREMIFRDSLPERLELVRRRAQDLARTAQQAAADSNTSAPSTPAPQPPWAQSAANTPDQRCPCGRAP
jgi:hypothetical protein